MRARARATERMCARGTQERRVGWTALVALVGAPADCVCVCVSVSVSVCVCVCVCGVCVYQHNRYYLLPLAICVQTLLNRAAKRDIKTSIALESKDDVMALYV